MIYIEGELRNILSEVCDHSWSACETEDGGYVCFSGAFGSYGNPADRLLQLILASEFPIYLRVDSYDDQNVELYLCKNPSDIKWIYDPERYIAFYDENDIIHCLTGVAVYFGDTEKAPEKTTLKHTGVGIQSLGKFIIEQYMNTHETVDKKFVQAIINWMM